MPPIALLLVAFVVLTVGSPDELLSGGTDVALEGQKTATALPPEYTLMHEVELDDEEGGTKGLTVMLP